MDDIQVRNYRIRNRVWFSPAPGALGFPTQPVIVETRRISDLTMEYLPKGKDNALPTGVEYIFFDQAVELQFAEHVDSEKQGRCDSLFTPGLNRELYVVAWSNEKAEALRRNQWQDIAVHPSLVGKMWVFGGSVEVAAQQRRGRGPTVVLDGSRHQ